MTALDLVVVGDPLDRLDPAVDTTLGIVTAALARGHHVRACEPTDLAIVDGRAVARTYDVRRGDCRWTPLADADAVVLRADDPHPDAVRVLDRVDPARLYRVAGVRPPGSTLCADFVADLEAASAERPRPALRLGSGCPSPTLD